MKLWKKIVLVASTLIVIVSTMVLPVFANDYITPGVQSLDVGYNYDASLMIRENYTGQGDPATKILFDLPNKFIVKADDYDSRASQSFVGQMVAYPMRNSGATESNWRRWEYLGILYNHTWNSPLLPDKDCSVEFQAIKPYGLTNIAVDGMEFHIDNFIYNKDSVKQIILRFSKFPDQQNEDYHIKVKLEVAEPVYVKDTGETKYISQIYEYDKKIFEEGVESRIGLIDPAVVYNSKYWMEKLNGERVEFETTGDNYVFIKSIDAEIYNANRETPPIYEDIVLDYFSIQLPFGDAYNMGNGRYETGIAPDNYLGWDRHLADVYKGERKIIQRVDFDGDFWDFIETSIAGFFDFEILPNLSIGGIVLTLVGLMLFIVLLKVFAGG